MQKSGQFPSELSYSPRIVNTTLIAACLDTVPVTRHHGLLWEALEGLSDVSHKKNKGWFAYGQSTPHPNYPNLSRREDILRY